MSNRVLSTPETVLCPHCGNAFRLDAEGGPSKIRTDVHGRTYREQVFDTGVVQDFDGKIVHNAPQQDDPIIRRVYDDGTIVLMSSRTGRHLVKPFRMDEQGNQTVVEDWPKS